MLGFRYDMPIHSCNFVIFPWLGSDPSPMTFISTKWTIDEYHRASAAFDLATPLIS
ncbi:hypothetical protein [Scytonema hofmannii]|uniref:hypothetical protein n=1 Tax=Scytonema hofmannii TaxID=34078 RepID=UPI000345B706|nr:hypothetical protein [Scytonema hofmannii]